MPSYPHAQRGCHDYILALDHKTFKCDFIIANALPLVTLVFIFISRPSTFANTNVTEYMNWSLLSLVVTT